MGEPNIGNTGWEEFKQENLLVQIWTVVWLTAAAISAVVFVAFIGYIIWAVLTGGQSDGGGN